MKKDPKKIVAGKCTCCGRELMVHPADPPADALKRKKWSNLNLRTDPPSGICPGCRKHGMHRR